MPTSREPVSLLSVDRAISELRRGRLIAIRGAGGIATLVQAAEAVTSESLKEINTSSKSNPGLSITSRRAAVLGLKKTTGKIISLTMKKNFSVEVIRNLADPLSKSPLSKGAISSLTIKNHKKPIYNCESAAVAITKLARLLPAAITAEIIDPKADDLAAWCARHDFLLIDAGDVFQYDNVQARTLQEVSSARVPLLNNENTKIIAFRPIDGGLEHLAIVIGNPEKNTPVLTRLHSECFTGDLLGSLRCDCGDQLQGATKEIAEAGSGILLYLAQEGRGIGLVNKLRAYELQDRGFDTIDANEQLGFDADERVYLPAAKILCLLGFEKVRLMTNNPDKVKGLTKYGISVVERVQHTFPSNEHNEHYLSTKVSRSGHIF
ncbi:MAG: GTP cyclohydrolase II [Pseudomonadota bacterium]|nr:GTP cyclohydrolase II [Pseudomonadota bacterium]